MRKILTGILALVLVLALSPLALAAEEQAADAQLVVTGTANVALKADMATIEIGAGTRGATVGEAHRENVAIMEKVIAELEKLGIKPEDIHTSQYSVYFEQDPSTYGTALPIRGTYVVTNMLFITIQDISKVSAAIDAASQAGANNIYSLTFQSSKSTEAYHQALRHAVEDGRAKAEVLALAAGKTLGEVIRLESNDTFGTPYGALKREQFAAGDAVATPILSGDVTVTAYVTLTYGLK